MLRIGWYKLFWPVVSGVAPCLSYPFPITLFLLKAIFAALPYKSVLQYALVQRSIQCASRSARFLAEIPTTPSIHNWPSVSSTSTLAPLPWTSYFAQEFHLTSPATPFVHHLYFTPPTTTSSPLFVLHHGAGCSGLSFAACAAEIKKRAPEVGLFAIDARGHGETVIKEGQDDAGSEAEMKDGKHDMSLENLARDLEIVLEMTKEKLGWERMPGLMLIGHSLGGAVVTHVAKGGRLGNKVLGFAVLDVVEGESCKSRLRSTVSLGPCLPRICYSGLVPKLQIFRGWPAKKCRICHGRIEEYELILGYKTNVISYTWNGNRVAVCTHHFILRQIHQSLTSSFSVRTRTIRGPLSARISVPSYLSPVLQSKLQPQAVQHTSQPSDSINSTSPPTSTFLPSSATDPLRPQSWIWRTDLSATSDYWENWFGGMSNKFLSARGGKLLLLAGTDRLDKELMIGQMQGNAPTPRYSSSTNLLIRNCSSILHTISASLYSLVPPLSQTLLIGYLTNYEQCR